MRTLSMSVLILAVALGGCAVTTTTPAPSPRKEYAVEPTEVRERGMPGFDPTNAVFAGRAREDATPRQAAVPPPEPPDLSDDQIEAVRAHSRTLFESPPTVRSRSLADRIVLSCRRPRFYESTLWTVASYYYGGYPGVVHSGYAELETDEWLQLCFETEEDTLYVLDIKVSNGSWSMGGVWNGTTEVLDGHLLVCFQATGAHSFLWIENESDDAGCFYRATLYPP